MQTSLNHSSKNDIIRYEAIIEGSNLGTWEWNAQTGETIFNEKWAEIIGYSLKEISPLSIKTWENFVHPDDFIESTRLLEQHFAGTLAYYELEVRMKHKKGHWVWVLDRGRVATRTPEGNPEWVFGTHLDISRQKELEELLRMRNENFKSFFNSNLDFLWVLDNSGKILKVNNTVTERLGYTEAELKSRSVLDVHPEGRRQEAQKIVGRMLSGEVSSCPIPIITKSGKQIPVETYVFPGKWDGTPALFGVSRDISQLKFSEEKFSKAFNTNPAIAGLSDLETGKYIEVNSSFYESLGFTPEETIGTRASELLKMDHSFRDSALSRMEHEGSVRNLETILYKKDGNPINVLLSADVIEIQDRKYNFTSALDISLQKQAEQKLIQSLNEKEMLMKEMNHRIKNNLSMLSSLINLECARPDREANLLKLKNRIEAIGIIHETLYKAEIFSQVNCRHYINKLLKRIFSSLSDRNIYINENISEQELPVDTIIPIGLIVNETATNAVKYGFTGNHKSEFYIELSAPDSDKMINLIISNNGPPINDEVKLEKPDSLGFQLIQALIKQLKGTHVIEKKPHPKFTFRFPGP